MSAVLLLLRGVPILAYVCGVLFLGLAYERHEATHWKNEWTLLKAQDATAKIAAMQATLQEDQRRIAAQKGVIDEQAPRLAAAEAAASAAGGTVQQLRTRLQAIGRTAAANHSATGGGISAASSTVVLLSDLLGRSEDTGAVLARALDASYRRGLGCEAQYQSLTP